MTEANTYGGKAIASLTDRQLLIAEEDVANCLLRAYQSPASAPVQMGEDGPVTDKGRYGAYFDKMSAPVNAIHAEKERRANG
jgi:hypothetical protein